MMAAEGEPTKKPGGRGRGTAAPKEEQQRFEGEPKHQRPSREGGMLQGSPEKKPAASVRRKGDLDLTSKFKDGITPDNFELVKNTLQNSLDYGWTKTKTVEQLRKVARMTVRQARECVKNELGEQRRWEDGIPEEKEE